MEKDLNKLLRTFDTLCIRIGIIIPTCTISQKRMPTLAMYFSQVNLKVQNQIYKIGLKQYWF